MQDKREIVLQLYRQNKSVETAWLAEELLKALSVIEWYAYRQGDNGAKARQYLDGKSATHDLAKQVQSDLLWRQEG